MDDKVLKAIQAASRRRHAGILEPVCKMPVPVKKPKKKVKQAKRKQRIKKPVQNRENQVNWDQLKLFCRRRGI